MKRDLSAPTAIDFGSLLPSDLQKIKDVAKRGDEEGIQQIRSAISDWLASQVLVSLSDNANDPEIADRVFVSFHKLRNTGFVERMENNCYLVKDVEHFVPKNIVKSQPKKWLIRSYAGEKHVDTKRLSEVLTLLCTRIEKAKGDEEHNFSVGAPNKSH